MLHSTAAACPATNANMVIQDSQVVFAPNGATWLLHGKAAGGAVEASASRPGIEHKTYSTTLRAKVGETVVEGTYTDPFCTYDVLLKRY